MDRLLGAVFGLATGVTHGFTLAWELSRAARRGPRPPLAYEALMSAIRGTGFGVGSAFLFGPLFGIVFGVLSTLGQTAAYRAGVSPARDYAPGTQLRTTRFQVLAALNRSAGYIVAGYIAALAGNLRNRAFSTGIETGLIIGLVTALCGSCTPLIEWTADHMPPRRMGIIGVCLIVTGFVLQSIQYWLILFDMAP